LPELVIEPKEEAPVEVTAPLLMVPRLAKLSPEAVEGLKVAVEPSLNQSPIRLPEPVTLPEQVKLPVVLSRVQPVDPLPPASSREVVEAPEPRYRTPVPILSRS